MSPNKLIQDYLLLGGSLEALSEAIKNALRKTQPQMTMETLVPPRVLVLSKYASAPPYTGRLLAPHEAHLYLGTINGKHTWSIVDKQFEEKLKWYNWGSGGVYAKATMRFFGISGRKSMTLGRLIMGAQPGDPKVDHIDNDPLNNTLANLRFVTDIQNAQNQKLSKRNTSGYTGVHFDKKLNLYYSSIVFEGKSYYRQKFQSAVEAAKWRDCMVFKIYGENYCGRLQVFDSFEEIAKELAANPHKYTESRPKSNKYRGVPVRPVLYLKQGYQWRAYIDYDHKKVWLGYFNSEAAAAHAHDLKAKELMLTTHKHLNFRLNFPNQ